MHIFIATGSSARYASIALLNALFGSDRSGFADGRDDGGDAQLPGVSVATNARSTIKTNPQIGATCFPRLASEPPRPMSELIIWILLSGPPFRWSSPQSG